MRRPAAGQAAVEDGEADPFAFEVFGQPDEHLHHLRVCAAHGSGGVQAQDNIAVVLLRPDGVYVHRSRRGQEG
jgi:hypothetical protein